MEQATTVVHIPMRTVSAPNAREHHMERAKRVKRERWAVGMVLNPLPRPQLPCVVLLTRDSPGARALDDDNLRGALKGVRDEVARWLGVDDGSSEVRWVYAQRQRRSWGVVVMAQADDCEELLQ